MADGRRFICDEIASRRTFSVDEVYEVYEYIREKKTAKKYVVHLVEQITTVEKVLVFAEDFQIKPMQVARFIFEESK